MPDTKPNDVVGFASAGGNRRAELLSPDQRKSIAKTAADARWDKQNLLPKAILSGTLEIAGTDISCAVLEDGTRLLTQETFLKAIGRAGKAKAGTGSERLVAGEAGLPPFLAATNLSDYVSKDLRQIAGPIAFRSVRGTRAYGYRAELLPQICEIYLKAKDEGKLLRVQEKAAIAAYLLMRGLAHVGILALVDEATGYQNQREKDALRQILKAYISDDLLPWTERFPREFFKQIYRLHGWEFNQNTTRRTPLVGKLINRWIYEQLPPGVLSELQTRNPTIQDKSYRRYKHHQYLTSDTGHQHLDRQITKIITLMQLSASKAEFEDMFSRLYKAEALVQPTLALEVPKGMGVVKKEDVKIVRKPNQSFVLQPNLFED
jgi:P63C domain